MSAPYRIYRDFFSPAECALLDSCPLDSAVSEISLIRVQLRRVMQSSRPSGLRARIGRSLRQGAQGPATLPPSKNRRSQSYSLKTLVSMLMTFNTTGIVLASLVRYHRHSLTSGLFIDPELEALAAPDDCAV